MDAARAKTLKPGSTLFNQCVPPPFPKYGKAMGDAYGKLHVMPAFQAASLSEDANLFTASAEQVRAARRWYGDMPLIVLTPAYPAVMPKNVPPDETQAHWTAETHAQLAMDDQMVALSTKGEARQVENTMHYIQLQQPEAVTKAVMDVLQQAAPQAQLRTAASP